MKTIGRHLMVEYWGCDRSALDDLSGIEAALREAARAAGASIVTSVFHPFEPHGVTGVVVVEESHLSIHTWPERGYAAVDFYTCGDCVPARADRVLRTHLKPSRVETIEVVRGVPSAVRSMRLLSHRRGWEGSVAELTEADAEPQRPRHSAPMALAA